MISIEVIMMDESIGEILRFVFEKISVTKVTSMTKPCNPFKHISENAMKMALSARRLAETISWF